MSESLRRRRWVAVLSAALLAVPLVWTAGCAEDFVGCVDPCGCTLFAEYLDITEITDAGTTNGFVVDITDGCGLLASLGPFDTLLEAEEAFELF